MAKVLLVEDDNNLREIYEARLQAEGYQIVSANDGEAALVVAKNEKPDLIISDVMMPKISGFEMLDILRNTDELKAVKVIMLTALGQADDQARADKLGADRYLVKSQVTLEDIVKVSHELLDGDSAATPDTSAAATPSIGSTSPVVPTLTVPVTPAPQIAAKEAPVEPSPLAPTIPAAVAAPVSEPNPVTTSAPVLTAPNVINVSPATNMPGDEVNSGTAQSSATEEATVVKQIENFVNNRPMVPTPSDNDATSNVTKVNDSSMTAAVDNLVADTSANQNLVANPPANNLTPAMTMPAQPVVLEPMTVTASEAPRKKIIQPLDSIPQKSLDELLAKEESQQAIIAATQAQPVSPTDNGPATPTNDQTSTPHPAGTVITPASTGPVDPNSIAL